MPRRVLSCFFLFALVGLVSATRVSADEVFTWTLPASSTISPDNENPGLAFEIAGVQFSLNGVSQGLGTFDFFSVGDGGGFDLFTTSNPLVLNEFGQQVYTGPAGNQEGMPTFLPGTYDLSGFSGGPLNGILTITAGPSGNDAFSFTLTNTVPEPSSLLLLGSGALGLLGFARRKIFS